MKKAKKVKESDSLSSATVDNIPVRELTEEEKRDPKNVPALAEHLKLEADAATFAEGFRPIFSEASKAYHKLESIRGTAKEYVQANLEVLRAIRKFFASNKARKNKTTLGGCLKFEEYALKHLLINDDYVRECFREAAKLPPAKAEGTEGGQANDEDEIPVQISASKFADNLQMKTVAAINDSSYSEEDKMKVTRIVLRKLENYAAELRLNLSTIPISAEVEAPAAEEAQGASA